MPTTMLTPHFTLDEFTASQTAARMGLPNMPSGQEMANLQRTAETMEKVRTILGDKPVLISSGYRSPAVNAAVGGASNSAHMSGLAVDFTAPGFGSPLDICHAANAAHGRARHRSTHLGVHVVGPSRARGRGNIGAPAGAHYRQQRHPERLRLSRAHGKSAQAPPRRLDGGYRAMAQGRFRSKGFHDVSLGDGEPDQRSRVANLTRSSVRRFASRRGEHVAGHGRGAQRRDGGGLEVAGCS